MTGDGIVDDVGRNHIDPNSVAMTKNEVFDEWFVIVPLDRTISDSTQRLSASSHDDHIRRTTPLPEGRKIPMPAITDQRQINVLLDLYSATDDIALRWTIADRLTDIRFLNAVVGDEMRADLHAIVAIASADVPSDLDWASYALESRLRGDVGSRPGSYAWSTAA